MTRKIYIDYLRILSMFSVILIHIFTTARTDFPVHSMFEECLSVIISHILHFAVPVFFMITGALFLKVSKKISLHTLYKKYILKYVIIILTFGWGYAFIEEMYNNNIIILSLCNSFINTISGNTWEHMWYLYTLIGILIILPIIKLIVEFNTKENGILKYILITLVVFSCIMPFLNQMFNITLNIYVPLNSVYILYMILGYLIDEENIKIDSKKCIAVILLGIAVIILLDFIAIKYDINNLYEIGSYHSPIILMISIAIFALFKNIFTTVSSIKFKIIEMLSKDSLGIYIVHMFWINVVYKYLNISIYGKMLFIKSILIFLIVSIISFLTIELLSKIPFVKNIRRNIL